MFMSVAMGHGAAFRGNDTKFRFATSVFDIIKTKILPPEMYLSHKSFKLHYGTAHALFCGQICTAITTFLDITRNLYAVRFRVGYRSMLHK